jgi:hypothetical protein
LKHETLNREIDVSTSACALLVSVFHVSVFHVSYVDTSISRFNVSCFNLLDFSSFKLFFVVNIIHHVQFSPMRRNETAALY